MKPLQLPPTVRTANKDELPRGGDYLERIENRKTSQIVEGYAFNINENKVSPFTFYAEINVDNDKLWLLFKTLFLQLPDQVCLIYNYKDADPSYSGYLDKFEALNILEAFQLEVAQDGFLEVGAIYNDDTILEEVFITSPKYINYWGVDEKRFRQTMDAFELNEINDLEFIDEYPFVTEPLRLFNPEITDTSEILEKLRSISVAEEE